MSYRILVSPEAQRGNDVLGNWVLPDGVEVPEECLPGNPLCTENPVLDPPPVTPEPPVTTPPAPKITDPGPGSGDPSPQGPLSDTGGTTGAFSLLLAGAALALGLLLWGRRRRGAFAPAGESS